MGQGGKVTKHGFQMTVIMEEQGMKALMEVQRYRFEKGEPYKRRTNTAIVEDALIALALAERQLASEEMLEALKEVPKVPEGPIDMAPEKIKEIFEQVKGEMEKDGKL